jgi:hypothetical protein
VTTIREHVVAHRESVCRSIQGPGRARPTPTFLSDRAGAAPWPRRQLPEDRRARVRCLLIEVAVRDPSPAHARAIARSAPSPSGSEVAHAERLRPSTVSWTVSYAVALVTSDN